MPQPNPYQPPLEQDDADISLPPLGYAVHGSYLLVRNGTRLPMRCVVTNQPLATSDYMRCRLRWRSPFRWPTMRDCHLSYCIHPRLAWRILIFGKLIPIGICVAGVAASLFLIRPGPLLILFGWILRQFMPQEPLKVDRWSNGCFWVVGCSPSFLEEIERSAANA